MNESKPTSGWNESRPKCPMCGEGRPMLTLAASWSCGTHAVFYDENGEYVEPSYQTGVECDKTIFRNGFLRCHDLLVTIYGCLSSGQFVPKETMELIRKEVEGEQ